MSTLKEDGKPKYCADCKYDNSGENRRTTGAPCLHPDYNDTTFFDAPGYHCWIARIERRITTEYPTRYEAFKNPRVLFEQKNTELTSRHAGAEFAVYHEPVKNTAYPDIEDGLYASVCSFQGRYYLTEIHATQPWKGRKQSGDSEHFDKYADAVDWLLENILKFQRFITIPEVV